MGVHGVTVWKEAGFKWPYVRPVRQRSMAGTDDTDRRDEPFCLIATSGVQVR